MLLALGKIAVTTAALLVPSDTVKCDTARVDGPTLIAFLAVTQNEVDADDAGQITEVLSDFQYHLDDARRDLEPLGVAVFEFYSDCIAVAGLPDPEVLRPREMQSRVGYLAIDVEGRRHLVGHVLTDIEIVQFVRDILLDGGSEGSEDDGGLERAQQPAPNKRLAPPLPSVAAENPPRPAGRW